VRPSDAEATTGVWLHRLKSRSEAHIIEYEALASKAGIGWSNLYTMEA
jgi:hypothetical protein